MRCSAVESTAENGLKCICAASEMTLNWSEQFFVFASCTHVL